MPRYYPQQDYCRHQNSRGCLAYLRHTTTDMLTLQTMNVGLLIIY